MSTWFLNKNTFDIQNAGKIIVFSIMSTCLYVISSMYLDSAEKCFLILPLSLKGKGNGRKQVRVQAVLYHLHVYLIHV